MKYYVIIDTNVLVSALLAKDEKSATVQVLELVLNKEVIPVFSKEMILEYHEVLLRKKFGFSEKAVNSIISYICQNGKLIIPNQTNEHMVDVKDLPFYEVTMDTRKENSLLITGNIKHFPQRDYIVTPREFINILETR